MQTFLPFDDFVRSISVLDARRARKQVIEASQLLDTLLNRKDKSGWSNHPAALMWRGYEDALKIYQAVAYELTSANTTWNKQQKEIVAPGVYPLPYWFGWPLFHESHKSRLYQKSVENVNKFNEELFNNLRNNGIANGSIGYVWPVQKQVESQALSNWLKTNPPSRCIIIQNPNECVNYVMHQEYKEAKGVSN